MHRIKDKDTVKMLEDVIKDRNVEIKDLQSELQHTSDDLEDSRRRGFKLFTLLVISTTLNLITVAVVTLTMMGKI